jgi:hypothetical protein
MSFEELRLVPGIDIEKTPSLNAAGISDAAFIRWKEGQVEKLGGWSRFYPFSIGSIPRALHAWEDLNQNIRLAIGATLGLKILTNGALTDITPQQTITNGPPNFSTTAGSPLVTIVDTNVSNPSTNDWVFIHDQVSAGGLLLFGMYQIVAALGANTYEINAGVNAPSTAAAVAAPAAPTLTDVAGGALGATTYFVKVTYVNPSGESIASAETNHVTAANRLLKVTSPIASGTATTYNVYVSNTAGGGSGAEVLQTPVPILIGTDWTEPTSGLVTSVFTPPTINSTGGSLPQFVTTSGSAVVHVNLKNHGLSAGQIAFFLDPTTLGGITIGANNYQAQAPVTANSYDIAANALATSSVVGFQNNGNLVIIYLIAIGPQIASAGWGTGTWGGGTWGIGNPPSQGAGTPITATDWSLFNFGQDLIANPAGGAIYEWGPESGLLNAGVIGQAPVVADGCFLTQPIQIIVAWGATFNGDVNPMRLVWCDAGNFLQWTPLSTNFAGGFIISRGSKIVACVQGANQFTVHTDIGVWSGQYIGQPLVFSIIEVMAGCGLVGRKAVGVAGTTIFWMSQNQLFQMAAGGVPTAMPCTVWDKVFQHIDRTNLDKVRFFANSQFTEIGWYFPTIGGNGENDTYVKVNNEGIWDYGPMGRSAWIDQSILGPPIGTTFGGLIYQHETSPDADGVALAPFIQTGDYALNKGEEFGIVDYVIPDAKYGLNGAPQTAKMLYTLFFKDFPNDTPRVQGPYTVSQLAQFFEPNMRGRLMSMRIESQDLGSFWRLGLVRSRIAPAGRNPL